MIELLLLSALTLLFFMEAHKLGSERQVFVPRWGHSPQSRALQGAGWAVALAAKLANLHGTAGSLCAATTFALVLGGMIMERRARLASSQLTSASSRPALSRGTAEPQIR